MEEKDTAKPSFILKHKLLISIAVFILAVIIAGLVVLKTFNSPTKMAKDENIFRIKRGMSLKRVASYLKRENLIRNKLFFYAAARIKGLSKRLTPGYYKITRDMSAIDIISMLLKGDFIKIRIVIPEGYTNLQIAYRLEKAGLFKKEDFMKASNDPSLLRSLGIGAPTSEGFLFPATYMFPYGASPKTIIKLMFANYKNATSSLGSPASGLSVYKSLILASIIEAETFVSAERSIIAGVYLNRLKKNYKLQADATVKYLKMPRILKLREEISKLKKLLDSVDDQTKKKEIEREIKILTKRATIVTYRDLKIDDPYNTYVNYGLPPGPICNPGLHAIKAAFRPRETPYLFYFWVPDENRHEFSTGYGSHLNKLRQVRTRNRIRN